MENNITNRTNSITNNEIEYVESDTDVCFVLWKQPCTGKKFLVGSLSKCSTGEFEFKYIYPAGFRAIGFNGIEAFSDFNKIYTRDKLFPVFSSRLPSKNRKDISKILKKYGLEKYDEFQLLVKSGGKLPIDNIEILRK